MRLRSACGRCRGAAKCRLVRAGQQQSAFTPKAQPNLLSHDKAIHPAPSANAKTAQKNSIGRGALTVNTAQPVDFGKNKLPEGWRQPTLCMIPTLACSVDTEKMIPSVPTCSLLTGVGAICSGQPGEKDGWVGLYAVELDAGKYAGNPTACGAAAINRQTGDIDIVAVE